MALKHILLITAVAGLVLGVPVILATGAFTSATLEREATVNVASDSQGLLALIDGHQGQGQTIVVEKSDGSLTIDLSTSHASGVNERGNFLIGSKSNPAGDHAFEIRNQGSDAVSISVNYNISTDPDGTTNIKFHLYHSAESRSATATEDTAGTIDKVQPGNSVYVVIEINSNQLSNGDDLSGDLSISANA